MYWLMPRWQDVVTVVLMGVAEATWVFLLIYCIVAS